MCPRSSLLQLCGEAADALGVQNEFLDEERHAGKRSRQGLPVGRGSRRIGQGLQNSVEFRVNFSDRLQRCFYQLARLDLLLRDEFGQSQAIVSAVFLQGQHRTASTCLIVALSAKL